MANDDDGAAVVLVSLGILAVAGIGLLKVLKSIGTYQPGTVISTAQAAILPIPDRGEQYAYCSVHGSDSEQCAYNDYSPPTHCIECGGGLGHEYHRWCKECDDYFSENISGADDD